MKDEAKTREQLINELAELHQRIVELEKVEEERKRAEEAARTWEEICRGVVESSAAVVYIVRAGRFEWVSPLFERISGYKSRELIGTRSLDYVHPQDREIVRKGAIGNLTGRSISPYAFRFMRKRGEPVWVLEKVSSIQYRGERAAVGSFMDLAKRKWVEEALKESEELSRGLLEAATVGTYIVQDGRFQYVNPQFEQISGYTSDELIGTYSLKYVHPDDRKKVGKKAKEYLKGQSSLPLPYEFRFISKDGRTLWVLERVASIEYRGKPAVVGSVMDITERRQAEEELQESEERYRTLVDHMEEGYVVFRGGRIRFANRRCAEVLGIPAEKLVGEDYLKFLAPESEELARQTYETIVGGGGVPHFQVYVYLAEDGRRLPVEVSMRKVTYEGKPSYAVVFRDITERKRMEETLRESEEKLRTIFESIGDAVDIVDLEGRIVDVNEAGLRLGGFSRKEDAIGRYGLDFIAEKDRARATEDMIKVFEVGHGPVREYTMVDKDGREYDGEASATLLRDSSGNPAGLISVLRDITERKRIEAALRESEEMYRGVLESAATGVCLIEEGKFRYVAPIFEMTSGYTSDELLGTYSLDYVHPDDREEVRKKAIEQLKGQSSSPYEFRFICKDGRTLWILGRLASIEYRGKPAAVANFLDITERKRMEEELRELEEKQRLVFESIGDGIVVTDLEGNIVDENEAALRLKGYSHKEDAIGQKGLDFIAERDRARATKDMMEALETEHGPAMEYTFVDVDGREFDGEASAALLRDSSGNPVGFISVVRDITERKRMEEALRESEALTRGLIEGATAGTYIVQDGKFQYVSPQFEQVSGYTSDEFLGVNSLEYVHPDDKEEVRKIAIEQLKGQSSLPYEYRFICKDGRALWILERVTSIEYRGRPAALGSIMDITERKWVEEELKKTEKKYGMVLATSIDGFWVVDMSGKFLDVNDAYCKMIGYSREELLKMKIPDIEAVEKPGETAARIKKIMEIGGDHFESKHRSKDGRIIDIEVSVNYLEETNQMAAFLRDITERKRAEEELRQSEERQRIVFEAIKDGIIVTDLEGRILDVNEATLRMQGQRREELIGQNSISFIAEEDRPMVAEDMKEVLKDVGTATMEYRWVAKDGTGFDSEASAALLRDSSGKPEGLIFVTRDITERKKIERMKSDFVSLVSHQLKTPVAEVRAYIENMLAGLTGDLTTKQEQYLQDMRDICSGNYRLISDLLDVSRIERGTVSVDIQPVELREVVDSALGDRRKRIEEKGLTLNLEEADERVAVLADKTKMAEALSNVIDNAVKFTDKGSIAIKMRRKGKYGIVEVKDTGKGMSRDVLKDLFKEGRVLAGPPTPGGGAGLGLYIARSLMKLQQGDITATSAVGKGSTVVLKIPRG